MVLDSSALVAILQDEPERRAFNERIEAAAEVRISAANLLEARIVLFTRFGESAVQALDAFLLRARIIVVEVSPRGRRTGVRCLPPLRERNGSSGRSQLRRLLRVRAGEAIRCAPSVQGPRLRAHRPSRRDRRRAVAGRPSPLTDRRLPTAYVSSCTPHRITRCPGAPASCCVNAAPPDDGGRLWSAGQFSRWGPPDRHRPPPAGERVTAARTDGSTATGSAISPGSCTSLRPFGPRAGQRPALQAVPRRLAGGAFAQQRGRAVGGPGVRRGWACRVVRG